MKAATIIFLVLALALGGGLFWRHNEAVKERQEKENLIESLNKKLAETSTKLDDQERISAILNTNLSQTSHELRSVSNSYSKVSEELRRTQSEAKAAADAAKAAEEAAKAEMARKEAQINQLQSQGDALSKKINGLEGSISELSKLIADTEAKLDAAEGDREFLLGELKRLQAEKAELERQFHDLALLRTQIAKLKEELSVSRRLEWIRAGLYGTATERKGAEMLMSGFNAAQPGSNFNLNVELRQDSGAKIVPPTPAPAPTNQAKP